MEKEDRPKTQLLQHLGALSSKPEDIEDGHDHTGERDSCGARVLQLFTRSLRLSTVSIPTAVVP